MQGPSNTNYTTTDSITGLAAGTYTLFINDISTNCTFSIGNVVVEGSYQDPRFTLIKQDVTCNNGNNGSITVDGELYGRSPFSYSIVAPSPMGIGTTNSTGFFNNLSAGYYSIRMTDSCGGIQTRQITVGNYSWWIDNYYFPKTGCNEVSGDIKVVDSRGNISTVGGIPGFSYAIVRAPGDTIWSLSPNFTFLLPPRSNTFEVLVRDNCGLIKKATLTIQMQPTTAPAVNSFNYLCNSFSASLTVSNFLNPLFCLYDSSNVLIVCNSNGIFSGLPYGKYCMEVHDECTDTTIRRCFNAIPPPIGISNIVNITNKTCYTFTVTTSGQIGLTNPTYCLYNGSDSLMGCNTTGIFTNLTYQQYCVRVHDGCRDTILTACFNAKPPIPSLPPVIAPGYITCSVFGLVVVGDSTTNPTYCLYDSNAVVINCNTTGVFDSIPFGNYCVTMHDECTDTTIKRCFGVTGPTIVNDMAIVIKNKDCSTFTAVASSSSFIKPGYCLYNAADSLLRCDSSGNFTGLSYGSYCIKATPTCPDTVFVQCFTVTPNLPMVASTVAISNPTCTTFTATITGQKNLLSPIYCIYNHMDSLLSCSPGPIFTSLPFGSYCIKINDGCFDTTIIRCFTRNPPIVNISASAGRSCSLGFVKANLSLGAGTLPVRIQVLKPDSTTLIDTLYNSNSITIDNIPGLLAGGKYKVVATDNCGNWDTTSIAAIGSFFSHSGEVVAKCPGSTWANGSGDIKASVGTNLGSLTVRIIEKDGTIYTPSRSPNVVSAGVFTFSDLGPGTYIVSSTENFCNKNFLDTISILPYQFPNLSRSSAYQCDINGFSVSAVASNGVPPFSYSIIGSIPTSPSIIAGPQTNPIFGINNGATYSLIRLRALDGCGNATLGDASILPLASNGISATQDCYSRPTTLSVDPIFNASYAWYKKTDSLSIDSTFITDQSSYHIPDLTLSETGYYQCYLSVNSGCINRQYNFTLTGMCSIILPVKLTAFDGRTINNKNILDWYVTQDEDIARYSIERKDEYNNYLSIAHTPALSDGQNNHSYTVIDKDPLAGRNTYRLKMISRNGKFNYSNQVVLNNTNAASFSIFPNPVKNELNILVKVNTNHAYRIILYNSLNQPVLSNNYTPGNSNVIRLSRPVGIIKGIYFIRITDVITGEVFTDKIIYL